MKFRICLAALTTLALAACAPGATPPPPATPTGPETEPETTPTAVSPEPTTVAPTSGDDLSGCSALAASLSLEARVGQLYMVGLSTEGLDQATREAIEDYQIGSVVLLGNSTAGVASIAAITDALAELELDVPLAVAVDQEGGTVQRLQGDGFSTIPSAVEQAELPEGQLGTAARGWAAELADAGVHWNLAPVADYVPAEKQSSNQPIGALQRNYGNDLDRASEAVAEYIQGMREAGVATSLKHFPGLGYVDANTDFDAAVDTDMVPDDERWQPFLDGMEAGASSVMVSSAVFSNLDPDQEGVFSNIVITDILRGELGYSGIVIADDLGAAGAVADIPAAERGLRFLEAGGDVVINADPGLMAEMVAATLDRAEDDPEFEQQITDSATRVLELKAWLGLAGCAA